MLNMSDCERLNYKKGDIFFEAEADVKKVYLIISGTATAKNRYIKMNLENGSIAGLIDICAGKYLFEYRAESDMAVLSFTIDGIDDIDSIKELGINYQELIDKSMFYQFSQIYNVYKDNFGEFVLELRKMNDERIKDIPIVNKRACEYLYDVSGLEKGVFHGIFGSQNSIPSYHMVLITQMVHTMDQVINKLLETFDNSILNFELVDDEVEENAQVQDDSTEESEDIEAGDVEKDYELVKKELAGSLKKILDYAELDKTEAMKYQMLIDNYRTLPDRTSSDNGVRELRKRISDGFYDIYEKVFLKSRKDSDISRVIEMFLTFGYMEEKEFDEQTLADLYYFKPLAEDAKYSVYTIYDWLCAIYDGKREPSKDEYDNDYRDQFREMKKTRAFTKAEENEYFSDQEAKVKYEIRNLLRVTNRITSGEITVFCPMLSQKRFTKEVKKMFLNAKKIEKAIDTILDIDYSLFHREQMYYDEANKIDNIMIMKQVTPDIILMPNVGSKGIMWQDVSEKKRDTPARFVMSEFFVGDLETVMISLAGMFRWELCRTIQGNYWNDLREHSLTADYCDYIQFYRKNKDLSEEIKEKIRTQYKNCRNNTRDMFVKDYEAWIKYEAKGALRLNKVTRKILYRYCPAALKYRQNLEKQPIFVDASSQFTCERAKKIKEIKMFNANVQKRNGTVTKILEDNLAFYEEM